MGSLLQININKLLDEKKTLRVNYQSAIKVKDYDRARSISRDMVEVDELIRAEMDQ